MQTTPARSELIARRFDDQAGVYDQQTEWRMDSSILHGIQALVGRGPGALVDLGTGTGLIAETLRESGWDVTGVDLSPGMLERARTRCSRTCLADVERLPFAPEAFQVATARQVIHYADDLAVCAEARRVVTRGGALVLADVVVVDAEDRSWWQEVKRLVQPLRRRVYTRDEHLAVVEQSGWRLEAELSLILHRSDPWPIFAASVLKDPRGLALLEALVTPERTGDLRCSFQLNDGRVRYLQGWHLLRARRP